jgi:hypothetical protein
MLAQIAGLVTGPMGRTVAITGQYGRGVGRPPRRRRQPSTVLRQKIGRRCDDAITREQLLAENSAREEVAGEAQ